MGKKRLSQVTEESVSQDQDPEQLSSGLCSVGSPCGVPGYP